MILTTAPSHKSQCLFQLLGILNISINAYKINPHIFLATITFLPHLFIHSAASLNFKIIITMWQRSIKWWHILILRKSFFKKICLCLSFLIHVFLSLLRLKRFSAYSCVPITDKPCFLVRNFHVGSNLIRITPWKQDLSWRETELLDDWFDSESCILLNVQNHWLSPP